jgi:hypothetical protein
MKDTDISLKGMGFSVCVRTRTGTLSACKSEGAVAFRLLNETQE